ncbi:MAG: hypothetical protein ACFFDT_12220, partial [Candidatus Hodarchaeota archaeon]
RSQRCKIFFLRYFSYGWIFLVIPFLILFLIGWKQSTKELALVALFFGLFSIAFNTFLSIGLRLSPFAAPRWVSHYKEDWISIPVPSFLEYIIHVFDLLLVKQFLGCVAFVFISGMTGLITKHLIKNGLKQTIKKINKPIALKSGTIILCLIFLMVLVTNYQSYPRYYFFSIRNTPPPTPEMTPLFYYFRHSQKNNPPDSFTNKIAEFGNLSFHDGPSLFQVSFDTPNLTIIEPTMNCTMNPVRSNGIKSEFSFPMLGILYLPSTYQGQTWLEIITTNISAISPIKGFNAEADTKNTSIEWLINYNFVKLSINTLVYTSTTNNSIYTFHFEKKTGWLMEATLIRDGNEEEYETLSLQRLFKIEACESEEEQREVINQYQILDFIFTIPIFLMSTSILIYTIFFYRKKRHFME